MIWKPMMPIKIMRRMSSSGLHSLIHILIQSYNNELREARLTNKWSHVSIYFQKYEIFGIIEKEFSQFE